MKKWIVLTLVLSMLLSAFAGCAQQSSTPTQPETAPKATENAAEETAAATDAAETTAAAVNAEDAQKEPAISARPEEPVTLTIFSELANYSGEQVGWIAQMMKEKFNVVLNIVSCPAGSGVYETRMESGFLGDIICWGSDGENYTRAIQAGLLYDWNYDDLLSDYGPYIKANMGAALEKNANITASATGGDPVTYGFGYNVASSTEDHESFFYTWDMRWDLYKQLGYPALKDMDGMVELFKAMKEICPTDDNDNPTYAVSLWPDWDGDMVMYVKAFASAYYGYDELGVGLYDSATGTYYDALMEDGPYIKALRFFNKLYQNDLLDPNSMSQTYDNMYEKVKAGGVFFSIFNYSGSLGYNGEEHKAQDKMMLSLVPEEASPIVYGMSVTGSNRIWSIGSNTEYPELCMEIINWLSTPEGTMTFWYGPKDLCWYYDDEGYIHWTDFGKTVYFDRKAQMIGEYEGTGDFNSGCLQANLNTWSMNATNMDSAAGERYNYEYWKSYQSAASCPIEQDWRDYTGVISIQDYMNNHKYSLSPATTFTLASKSDDFKTTWKGVTDIIKSFSWRAIYAKSDTAFDNIVKQMISQAKGYGYDDCVEWTREQAGIRHALELEVTGK